MTVTPNRIGIVRIRRRRAYIHILAPPNWKIEETAGASGRPRPKVQVTG